jgi:hypothetical protein
VGRSAGLALVMAHGHHDDGDNGTPFLTHTTKFRMHWRVLNPRASACRTGNLSCMEEKGLICIWFQFCMMVMTPYSLLGAYRRF